MDTIETRSHRGIMLLLVPLMLVLFISTLDQTMATGALNFAKTLGGAFGAAVFGAILTGHLGAGAMAAFQAVFFWTVPFMGLALLLALVMREQPLSGEMIEVAAGKVEVAEY